MDKVRLWKSVLDELELLVTKPVFGTFIAPSQLLQLENSVATIGCNTTMAINMIENRYYSLVKSLLDKRLNQNTSLVFKLAPLRVTAATDAGPLFSDSVSGAMPRMPGSAQSAVRAARLRPDFTFETFAVSGANNMAYAAATAVSENPGTSYNPLFFYGGVGVGKTHLMQAIGNAVLSRLPDTKAIYCMGEEFTNEIVDAIQTKTTKKFKDRYRSARVLLIDDVQFLAGKERVQEEFFHTFNAVQRDGGQIVLTSDRPPHEIDRLEDRLQSRFEGGLLVDIQNPDFELRCAILRIKAQQKGVDLPLPVAQILAANTESIRKLEGLLARLLTEAAFNKIPVSEDLARELVGSPQTQIEDRARRITPKEVAELVIKRFGVSLTQLKSPRRARPVARPRQVLMYLLRTELKLPLEEVGLWVGGRDHTTVMHAVETISTLLSTNPPLRDDVLWIKGRLFG